MSSVTATRTSTRASARVSRVKAQARTDWVSLVMNKALLFGCTAAVVYLGASMGFQVMKEGARRARISASERALSARREMVGLENRVNWLSRPDRIEEWALAHGYSRRSVVPVPPAGGSRVAYKD